MPDDPETYLAVLKATYDYEPQPDADDELAIKEDQILFLIERVDDDWWKVRPKQDDDAPTGLVPAAYVEQCEHTSVVKALYDYDATNPGELTIKEDEILHVYDKDDAWLLVHSQNPDGRVGFVPETYVEEVGEGSKAAAQVVSSIPNIVVPPSPPRPISTYVDPADRVAAASNKAKADDIQTWSVSEIDKKGKKKKGTLGVGSGAVFFTSESDKAPVQKWQTAHLASARIDRDKSKHVLVEIGGSNPASLHFNAGSKDAAEAIVKKLEASKKLSAPPETLEEPRASPERPRSAAKTVHFDAAPAIIPDPEDIDEEPEQGGSQEYDPNAAVALYDFAADGDDELTVAEGEDLIVLDSEADDWWKVRNSQGEEGVVPASYVELRNPSAAGDAARKTHEAELEARQEAEAQAEAEQERRRKEVEEAEETAKKERAKEAARRAEAAAAAEKKRRDKERIEREKEREKQEKERKLAAKRDEGGKSQSSSGSKSNGDTESPRQSSDRRPPPSDKTRIWHDRSGQFRVEAAFLGYHNHKLRLHKANGVIIEVPAEKMSAEDIRYVEKMTSQKKRSSESSPGPRSPSDDDEPLATRRHSLRLNAKATQQPQKKKPRTDWFEFFLNSGCDVDDCTRYADAFDRDKIDEAILGDITEGTMRSLGLREGDIIRVKKHIETSRPKAAKEDSVQVKNDEELARMLQEEEYSGSKRSAAPNLFAGPNGALKNNTAQRRGRPTPSKTLPPASVDASAISNASETIKRTGSPALLSPSSPAHGPVRAGSVPPTSNGFDDDAWTNRPSSTKPLTPTPTPPIQPQQPRTTSVRPQSPPEPPAPPHGTVETKSAPTPQQDQTGKAGGGLAKTTEDDVFNQLARLASLRTQSPAVTSGPSPLQQSVSAPSPAVVSPPPGFGSGMGVGNSPVPIAQLQSGALSLQPQLTASPSLNAPRGPFAPVPANQGLLQPLVPTRTGFTGFVPTGLSNGIANNSAGIGGGLQPQQGVLPQQTGFPNQPVLSNPTGFPVNGIGQAQGLPQQTGFQNTSGFHTPSPVPPVPPVPPLPNFQPTGVYSNPTGFQPGGPGFGGLGNGFGGVQSTPTGFPGAMGGPIQFNPQPPQNQNQPNTAPANVFAQMKAGTFAQNTDTTAQPANKYDALRPNPLAAQSTGWFPGPGAYGSF